MVHEINDERLNAMVLVLKLTLGNHGRIPFIVNNCVRTFIFIIIPMFLKESIDDQWFIFTPLPPGGARGLEQM